MISSAEATTLFKHIDSFPLYRRYEIDMLMPQNKREAELLTHLWKPQLSRETIARGIPLVEKRLSLHVPVNKVPRLLRGTLQLTYFTRKIQFKTPLADKLGHRVEPIALKWYSAFGWNVKTCGPIHHPHMRYMVFTPDGVAFKDGKFSHLIEVKTVASLQKGHMSGIGPDQEHCFTIDQRSETWLQIQLYMALSNTTFIDVIVIVRSPTIKVMGRRFNIDHHFVATMLLDISNAYPAMFPRIAKQAAF